MSNVSPLHNPSNMSFDAIMSDSPLCPEDTKSGGEGLDDKCVADVTLLVRESVQF